ncbi:MAG: DUF5684 domain-containing protein [Demequina sp.]
MTPPDSSAAATQGLILALIAALTGLALYVWYAWALSRVFPRLGADAWRGWVPVVNEMTIFERGGVPAWNVAFYYVPIANLYALYLRFVATGRINAQCGRGAGMSVLAVLVPPVWATSLALSRAADAGIAPPSDSAVAHRQVQGGLGEAQRAPRTPLPPVPVAPHAADAEPHSERHDQISSHAVGTPQTTPAEPILVHDPWARDVASRAGSVGTVEAAPVEVPSWIGAVGASGPSSPPLGAPALHAAPDADDGETVVVDRRPRVHWFLAVDGASPLKLTSERVVLGRRPPATEPGTQPLAVPDPTRTVSKSHARLDLVEGSWVITDLHSTNGVLLVDAEGREELAQPGQAVAVTPRFVLGKLGMTITFEAEAE